MTIEAYRTDYDAIEKEAMELATAELLRVNIDPAAAVLLVAGALPRLMALREEVVAQLPRFRVSHLDKLESYAKGLGHAHALHRLARRVRREVPEFAARAAALSESLEEDARTLARRGLVDAEQFARLTVKQQGKRSYKALVFQLIGLVELFRTGWAEAENRTPVTEAELADAERLAAEFGDAIGIRAVGDEEDNDSSDAALMRRRFYTLFYVAYDQVRRAVTYLRWDHDDADLYAPSVHLRGARTIDDGEVVTDPAAPNTEVRGAAGPTTPAVAPTPATLVRPGFPGGEPFEPEPAKS